MPEEEALQLFKQYYPRHLSSEDNIFKQIRKAVGGNTLVIELLAKNLYRVNPLKVNYTLLNLLADLQEKGLLALSKSAEVSNIDYQTKAGNMRTEKPEDVIAAMYDLSELAVNEVTVLSVFAVLPAESLSYSILEMLLPKTEYLETILLSLAQKGWLEYDNQTVSFKVSPVVQEISRKKNKHLLDHCLT